MDIDSDFDVFKKERNTNKLIICKNCHGDKIENDYKQGITYCIDCGTHHSDTIISFSPEWKSSSEIGESNTLNRCNCVIDPLLKKMSMSTRLIGVPRHISLVHSWHTQHSYKEGSLSTIFRKMEKIGQENAIPHAIIKYAENIYALISNKNLKRGASRLGIIGACIYYGCKSRNIMKREKDIAKLFNIDTDYISKGCDIVAEYLFKQGMDADQILAPFGIYDYIEEYSNILDLSKKFKKKVLKIANVVNANNDKLKNMPYSLAAGCIYFVAAESNQYNTNVLKKEMKEKCDISDVTIAKCYNNILSLKQEIIEELRKR